MVGQTASSIQLALRRVRRAISALGCGVLLCAVAVTSADAQYFGRNKVQFNRFDFKVLETEHFDLYYYPQEAEAAQQVARLAERWYTRLSTALQHSLSGRQPLVIYASHPEFEETNVVEGLIDEGTGGVTEGLQRRVVLPLAASLRETDHVLGHELVHAFQYDMLGRNIQSVPLWVVEGMAEYLSLGPRDPQTAMWLRDAAREGRLPAISALDDPRYFPYRFGHAFWAYVGGRFGDSAISTILHTLGGAQAAGPADPVNVIEVVTGQKRDALSRDWHAAILDTYGVSAREPDTRDPILEPERAFRRSGQNRLDIGPALSPNGKRMAFLSERSQLAIDLYVAELDDTGGRARQLTKTAADPHFQSLQFLASAGSWAPDNRRLAVAAVRHGRAIIAIFDADSGRILREIPLETTGEVFSPAWSPDGASIAFTAQVGGFTDLNVVTVESGASRSLTKDPFADLQPAWSPDGRQLAFVTDRFSSSLESLTFGRYELALMDVGSGRIERLSSETDGDAINPAWASNDVLLFVSTRTGRPEVYQRGRTGMATLVTSAATGIAGITPLSSTLSVSASADLAAYTVFVDGGYEIRLRPLTSSNTPTQSAERDWSVLPPVERRTSGAVALAAVGVPRTLETTERDYRARLSLVDIGQSVGFGAGGGDYGTFVSGGISMLFSDVLGHHLVPATVSVNGRLQDVAAQAAYINRSRRWNWGVFGERVPLLSGTIAPSSEVVDGQPVYVETTTLLRQTSSQMGVLAAYPFTRTLRVEVSTGLRHIGFTEESERLVFDPASGVLLDRMTATSSAAPSLRLFETSAALVRDTSTMGAVGPVLGQRFRLEASPTWGDLSLVDVSTDFRQYVSPVRPVTLAVRLLHLGRYGGDAEDERLFPYFLGYSTLVRGYDANSFTTEDCTPAGFDPCPEFNGLTGSRVALFNAEARVPLVGAVTGKYDYGPIPVELFAFADGGVAWNRIDGAVPGADRHWARSVGAGVRVNLLGYAIGEFNLVRPLDRRSSRWDFVFNLRPGF